MTWPKCVLDPRLCGVLGSLLKTARLANSHLIHVDPTVRSLNQNKDSVALSHVDKD
jgi:hypothetical protein